ncbi:hypothetical protein [Streptomyces nigrescens]
MVDGTLDPAAGAFRIWRRRLGPRLPGRTAAARRGAYNLDGWDDSWGVPVEKLKKEAIEAAAHFLAQQPQAEHD